MSTWTIWLLAACVLAVGEIFTLTFFLAAFSGGALAATLASSLGANDVITWAVFLVISVLLLLVVRPIARSHRKLTPGTRIGPEALIGETAVVLERISNLESVGCVRVKDEVWTARTLIDEEAFDIGEKVTVVKIRGATAVVERDLALTSG